MSPLFRKRRKPVTTDSNHKLKPSPNLLEQKVHCQTPNTVRLADITYIDTDEGWLYLAGIKDMATREIVGWAMEDHMRAELCCEALKMALGRRGPVPGLIHHSDRGKIEDADFALETTELAKNQILQQASTAMLAQANASKQNVLGLLRS